MTREMLSAEHKRTSSPFHSQWMRIHRMNRLGSHARWKKGVEEVFASPFHLPVYMNGEEGNHCHTSRYSTKPSDCILDSAMLFSFFFFSYRETKCSCTAWLTHCLIALHTPPHPIFFKSSTILFFIPASQFAFRWKWLLFKQSHNSTVTRDFFILFLF